MIYYSNEARISAIEEINKSIDKINSIDGNILTYEESSAITKYLIDYKKLIEKELE